MTAAATALIRGDTTRLNRDLSKARGMFARTFRGIRNNVRGALSSALAPLGLIGGAAGFAAIGRDVLQFEDQLNRIGIQANMAPEAIEAMRASMLNLSKTSGIARGDIVGAGTALINLTGDIEFTKRNLDVLARANLATGATMQDLAGLSFALGNAFGLADPAEVEKGLSAITEAGKRGAIPLAQMSVILQQVAASFEGVTAGGVEGAAELAAALQVARRGFGTAEQAGTGLQAMMTAFAKKAGKLEKAGIRVFDKDPATGEKRFRNIGKILDDFQNSKLLKDPTLMAKALGRVEAVKTIQVLTKFRGAFDELAEGAKGSNAIQEDALKRTQSTAFKIQKAVNDLKERLADVFTPARIQKFADALEKMVELVEKLIDNWKIVALTIGAIKLGGLVGSFSSLATMSATAAGNAGRLSGTVGRTTGKVGKLAGKIGVLGQAVEALAIGFAVGTALDQAFGLSDKLSGTTKEGLERSNKQFSGLEGSARNAVTDMNPILARRIHQQIFADNRAGKRTELTNNQRGGISRTLFAARESGILENGEVDRGRAIELLGDRLGRRFAGSIERALKLKQALEVQVRVDAEGRIAAEGRSVNE